MAATTSSSFASLASVFQDGPLAAVAQEIAVLCVFALSFVAWRHIGRKSGRSLSSKGIKLAKHTPAKDAKIGDDSPQNQRRSPRSNVATNNDPDQYKAIRGAEQTILKHLEHREFTRALNLYRSIEREGKERYFSEELYSAFIQSAIRVGKVDVVERMLRTLRGADLKLSPKFWQTTLRMLSSRKHYSTCVVAHTLFQNQLPAEKVVYSCLINAALEMNSPERAVTMLDRYAEADLGPKDYVLFFRVYVAANDVEAAEAVFRKLGNDASTLMLNLLLLTCTNSKQADRGLAFLREAHGLEKGLQEKIVDVVSYNTVIKGFAQNGSRKQCLECLKEMHAHQIEPDDITFGTLLDACIVDNDIDSANEIVNLLVEDDRPMDTVMCTLFIKGLVRANCLPKALELYQKMHGRDGAHPDIITYSVLIKALVDQHELEQALGLVSDMKTYGLVADDIILTHLLEGCRHAANHQLGKRLFDEQLAAGVKPSEYTLVTMLKLHGRCGAHTEAYDLVKNWEPQHGFKPSIIHYTCLVSGCLRTKSYDQAWSAYELMCANGVALDSMAASTLLPGMIAAQRWDRVLLLVEESIHKLAKNRIGLPAETLNNALSQMMHTDGGSKYASQLRTLMNMANIPITTRTHRRAS